MDHAAFVRAADRGVVPPVTLIHGADVQLLDDALAAATRGLFPDADAAALGREVVDARETPLEAVLRSAQTLPFMTAARLIAVRRCQACPAKAADLLAAYVGDPNPATRLLFLAEEPLGATRDRKEHWLLRAIPPAAIVELRPRRGRALEDWLRARAAAEGLTVGEEAARLLVQWAGEDGATLLAEARKAALAGGAENRAVGVAEVGAIVGENRLSDVFELTRALERREGGLALKTLDRLLDTVDAPFLLAQLSREIRTAWTIREWRARGQSVDQIARALRRPPGVVEAIARTGASLELAELRRRLVRCWEVERRLKSSGEARAEITALVAELCRGG
jgi:DNA polymerase III delta subunit